MRNAWSHVEAVQTTDVPALLNHIADVLNWSIAHPADVEHACRQGDLSQRQEILAFYYLAGLLSVLHDVREDR